MPEARTLVGGSAEGPVLVLEEPLSFWGGIDPTTGDPVPETPCHQVVDRTVVTTATDQLGAMENENGQQGCGLVCTASIVCVCDP